MARFSAGQGLLCQVLLHFIKVLRMSVLGHLRVGGRSASARFTSSGSEQRQHLESGSFPSPASFQNGILQSSRNRENNIFFRVAVFILINLRFRSNKSVGLLL